MATKENTNPKSLLARIFNPDLKSYHRFDLYGSVTVLGLLLWFGFTQLRFEEVSLQNAESVLLAVATVVVSHRFGELLKELYGRRVASDRKPNA